MEDRSKEQNTQSCEAQVHFTSEELLDLIGSPTIPGSGQSLISVW